MKIIAKTLVAIGVFCLFFGVVLFGVAMLTGGSLESVITHNIAVPYWDRALANINTVVTYVVGIINNLISLFA